MMKHFFKPLLLPFLILVGTDIGARDSAYINFRFQPQLNPRKFYIKIYDGINEITITPQSKNYWNGSLFAPFGLIEIGYKKSDSTTAIKRCFFKKGPSVLKLIMVADSLAYYAIDERGSANMVSYKSMGGANYDAFIKPHYDTLIRFYQDNKARLGTEPALLEKAFALGDVIFYKNLEFIKQHPNLYLSLWIFQNSIIQSALLPPDSLLVFYQTILPDKYKNSPAAQHTRNLLQNKIAVNSGGTFPDFSAVDVEKKSYSAAGLKNRYVLIQFWASWCKPCIQEVPILKKIHEKYKDAPFTLISFSIDQDSLAFRKAIVQHAMDWPQVFGDDRLYKALLVIPIPQLYLIDKTGKTIYNSTFINDKELNLLKKILAEHLDNRN
ncbi:TlpA family protein disulfide reductase [Niabella sp. CC-SYL272]|uniref:TlpA family protein disulfide reductase n=1 Tax=Niabella agricola TaxID=2891571 RepID=UPI001F46295C|nr:TlpA disulfide reductase family protein [Niabella agricola]MCF3110499.1 TlpA family protein disulfide reductase [Niabella agricola]